MAGYIGAAAVPQATESRDVFTATSNQTSFATSGYTPGFVSVYLNGVHLARADFTATNGSDVVLAAGATEDDTVEIVSFSTFELSAQTFSGNVTIGDGNLVLGSTAVSSTAAELNILDGVTATAAEINLIDGGTARGTTAVADGDGFLTNDGGTMRMTKVDTLATYMGTKIGGGMEFIASSGAISNAANVSFTGFDSSKYDSYEFRFIDFLPATDDAVLRALTSSDTSNPSYDTGANDYRYGLSTVTTAAYADVNGNTPHGNAANEGFVGIVRVINPHTSTHTKVTTTDGMYYINDNWSYPLYYNGSSRRAGGFVREENAQVNAIRFYWSSGNIASGEIVMFGIVNS